MKKLRPDVEIVDQQWPKLNEPEYTPFITAQMAKKPDAVMSVICCGNFDTFAKQAKPLGYFESINSNMLAVGEAGSVETARSLGNDYPVGIWGNTYDAFFWDAGPAHRAYLERVKKYLNDQQPSSWVIQGYIAMQFLTEAIKKANSIESDKVSKALLGLTLDTPHGSMTMREKDHQCNRGQLYGKMVKDPAYPFPILNPVVYVDPSKFMD
jgi:branched-chain amino acid transport system substrate-binding protein